MKNIKKRAHPLKGDTYRVAFYKITTTSRCGVKFALFRDAEREFLNFYFMFHLLLLENMKNEDSGGMGTILVADLTSDMRRGRAITMLPSSSYSENATQMHPIKTRVLIWNITASVLLKLMVPHQDDFW